MLQIRQEQADILQVANLSAFVERAVQHLRRSLANQVKDRADDELSAWVADVAGRGESFGLRTEKQIMHLLDAEVLVGRKFYEEPEHDWAKLVLTSGHLAPDEKAGILLATACSFASGQST